MTVIGWLQLVLFALLILICTKPLGAFIWKVVEGERNVLSPMLRPVENILFKLCGISEDAEMDWKEYSYSILALSAVSAIGTYLLLRSQGLLPLNPMGFSTASAPSWATTVTPDLAFNTAISFTTNTNWQAYAGESTLSYLSQMLALATHNWFSAAVGIAAAIALIRGFARVNTKTLGNFWMDLIRIHLYILFPLCFVGALLMVSEGCVQNFNAYTTFVGLEGTKLILPQGPVASQEIIKMLGTNGGGLFNANSAHPFENPTPLTNLFQVLLIFLIPAALTYTFGKAVKDTRQGWALLIAMSILCFTGFGVLYYFEAEGNPNIAGQGVETSTAKLADLGGNMEGKEVRFGIADSALFATVTTDASCGAVNCMHDSLTPLGGLVPMVNIQLGELIFGGVGSGLYGMLIFGILTVFIAGLMVGRTPEYLGKKIEQKEVKLAMLFVLAAAFSVLTFTAMSSIMDLPAQAQINAPGSPCNNVNNGAAHGFSELLYTFTSATGNNGSAFAGINVNTPYYNILTAIAMLIGRFAMMIPAIAIAGTLCQKKFVPASSGTFPTYGAMFIILLISVIIIVGALTFFPALTLGPIVEHFLMHDGRLF
ncbi:MAG TPA: potassium-transporting ATPase subunit KdpA [Planktothrix sp.]|jgi:K+-transporting ATPase ATPase A chain